MDMTSHYDVTYRWIALAIVCMMHLVPCRCDLWFSRYRGQDAGAAAAATAAAALPPPASLPFPPPPSHCDTRRRLATCQRRSARPAREVAVTSADDGELVTWYECDVTL